MCTPSRLPLESEVRKSSVVAITGGIRSVGFRIPTIAKLWSDSRNCSQQIGYRCGVSKSLADVHVQVEIAGRENEASPELKRTLA